MNWYLKFSSNNQISKVLNYIGLKHGDQVYVVNPSMSNEIM